MFNRLGVLRSLRARRVVAGEGPKNLAPAGFFTGGLVMADALGRKLLATGQRPESWPATVPLRIVVAEGEPDFLTWATHFSDADEAAPAVKDAVDKAAEGTKSGVDMAAEGTKSGLDFAHGKASEGLDFVAKKAASQGGTPLEADAESAAVDVPEV